MTHAILGGGISGLSAAYYLSKALPNTIKIYESSNRLGGWIRSVKSKNGATFELGPRSVRPKGEAAQNTLQLVNELDLTSSIYVVSKDSVAAKNRMIFYNNQVICLPNSAKALFKINPPFVRPFICALWKDLVTPGKKIEDETVHDFICRRFGEDYAENLFGAMVCGIFAGDAKTISVRALLNNIFENEQKHGSVLSGALRSIKNKPPEKIATTGWSVWSFQNGLETLPNQLKDILLKKDNIKVSLNQKCTNVSFENGKVILKVNGKTETADHLYSSLSSKQLASILGDEHSFLKKQLSFIPFVNVAVVNLEYKGDLIKEKGFGVLVPPNQNLQILGITYDSCIFPQEGKTVLTVMMGGHWFKQHFGENPDEDYLLKIAEDHVKKILNIHEKPIDSLVSVLKDCIPQYVVGHQKAVKSAREYIAKNKLPLTIVGNSYDGVGVNDAIFSAKLGVDKALANSGVQSSI